MDKPKDIQDALIFGQKEGFNQAIQKCQDEIDRDGYLEFAEWLHNTYERLSNVMGWKGMKSCKNKPWNKLPIENQNVMIKLAELIKKKFSTKLENLRKETFNPEEISLCPYCNCMTHTLYKDNTCGKCGYIKEEIKLEDLK